MGTPIPYTQLNSGYWRVSGVNYRGKTGQTFDLLDGLLPAMTQEQAGARTRAAQPGDFVHVDLPLHFGIFDALEKQQEEFDVSAPVNFMRTSMRGSPLMTLTEVEYKSADKDTVTHGVGTEKPYQQKATVVGPDRQITKEDGACLETLVGTADVARVDKVLRFINGTPTWVWRVHSRPHEATRRVVWLLADSGGVYLGCGRDPQVSVPAFGVRQVA